mmetsp:Transcript_97182/g.279739  ORF Transcript_97182/g.279739 Transcript_97182/m.279739 type:complete len:220 (+) Transcript_97182:1089-1748(+)
MPACPGSAVEAPPLPPAGAEEDEDEEDEEDDVEALRFGADCGGRRTARAAATPSFGRRPKAPVTGCCINIPGMEPGGIIIGGPRMPTGRVPIPGAIIIGMPVGMPEKPQGRIIGMPRACQAAIIKPGWPNICCCIMPGGMPPGIMPSCAAYAFLCFLSFFVFRFSSFSLLVGFLRSRSSLSPSSSEPLCFLRFGAWASFGALALASCSSTAALNRRRSV